MIPDALRGLNLSRQVELMVGTSRLLIWNLHVVNEFSNNMLFLSVSSARFMNELVNIY
jgi:hypothetical protein